MYWETGNYFLSLGTRAMLQTGDQSQKFWLLESVLGMILIVSAIAAILCISLFVSGVYLSRTHFFRSWTLYTTQDTHQGYTAQIHSDDLVGSEGITETPLRPSGKALICGLRYNVTTPGTYVAPGVAVVVTNISGTSLVVEAVRPV